jgi:hypothetical protein
MRCAHPVSRNSGEAGSDRTGGRNFGTEAVWAFFRGVTVNTLGQPGARKYCIPSQKPHPCGPYSAASPVQPRSRHTDMFSVWETGRRRLRRAPRSEDDSSIRLHRRGSRCAHEPARSTDRQGRQPAQSREPFLARSRKRPRSLLHKSGPTPARAGCYSSPIIGGRGTNRASTANLLFPLISGR